MKPECALPCSHKQATGPYPEPAAAMAHFLPHFFMIH